MTLSRLPSSRDDYVSCRTTEPQCSRKTYHRATRVPVANSFCSWPLLAKHGIANRAYAQTHTDTDTLSHIWETYVPNVYAFSLHEYKPPVHGNIYISIVPIVDVRERGGRGILHHDARSVPWYKTHDTCVRAFNTPWTYGGIGRFGIIRARERNIMQPPALSGLPGSCGMYHPFCPPILYNREKTRAAFVVVNTSPDY